MLQRNVARGVHRVQDSYVNWYIVEDGNDLTVVDCGMPKSWNSLQEVVTQLGRRLSDIKAVVLTHAHFDHVGFAERARRELNVPVWCHQAEVPITQHPLSYEHEKSRLWYSWRPFLMKAMASFISWGMLGVDPIGEVKTYVDGQTLEVPGRPKVIFTPGHTIGHSCLHLEDRDTLLAGDAFVLLDPYTGRTGPRVVARAATASVHQAKQSLDRVAVVPANIVLTGHGDPWTNGAAEGAQQAQAAPVA